ncbi:MAG: alanine--tRNA ligase-related protein, partial [Nanopusillaceae archaeon]
MATEFLYWKDSYLKSADAKVIKIDGNKVILDKTIFHPRSGGLQSDTGKIIYKNEEYIVKEVVKEGDDAVHILDRNPNFNVGDTINMILDWDRRYKLMRLHTASHIIAAIIYRKYGASITGGDISTEYARDDFNLELSGEDLKKAIEEVIEEANEIISKGIPVKVFFLRREEALKIPG